MSFFALVLHLRLRIIEQYVRMKGGKPCQGEGAFLIFLHLYKDR